MEYLKTVEISENGILRHVEDAVKIVTQLYFNNEYIQIFENLTRKAVELSRSDISDMKENSEIGEGWSAEETLAFNY